MEQRRLRLGDILDDYCPRERRVTNHAIVAMIEETIRQTRCTTCDTEHVYKGARVPKRRRKDTPAALFKDVLAGMPEVDQPRAADLAARTAAESPDRRVTAISETSAPQVGPDSIEEEPQPLMQSDPPPPKSYPASATDPVAVPETAEPVARVSREPDAGAPVGPERVLDDSSTGDGPVHRRLIRATLPRPEGQKDARPLPEFTARAPRNGQGGHFRGERLRGRSGQAAGQGESNGNRAHGPHNRFQAGRSAGGGRPPAGRGGGFRGGPGAKGGRRGRGSR